MKTTLFIILLVLSVNMYAHECPEWVEVETKISLRMMRVSHIMSVNYFRDESVYISSCVPETDVEQRCIPIEIPKSSYDVVRDALLCEDAQNNDLN